MSVDNHSCWAMTVVSFLCRVLILCIGVTFMDILELELGLNIVVRVRTWLLTVVTLVVFQDLSLNMFVFNKHGL